MTSKRVGAVKSKTTNREQSGAKGRDRMIPKQQKMMMGRTPTKKESLHFIPPSKTAKGRRPHSEKVVRTEPYQPPLLDEADLEPRLKPDLYSSLTTSAPGVEEKESSMSSSTKSENKGTNTETTKGTVDGKDNQPSFAFTASTEETKAHATTAQDEVIVEGKAAPKARSSKTEIKNKLESIVGAVQLGTSLMKGAFPKPFEVAEKVVDEWKKGGDFSELPISQPLVQFYVGAGLRRAKKTEKELEQKLESAGVLPVVRQQWQRAQKYLK